MSEEEIILSELSLEDLYELMKEDLYDGLAAEIEEEVHEALGRGQQPYEVLTNGLVAGMEIVGNDFRDGILFVPEVLMAAKAMKAGMAILRPLLAETGAEKIGSMVIGTVKGDIHDIGKNLVTMMLEGAGFAVHDLGADVHPSRFVAAVTEHQPDVVALSALLTTTMPSMQATIDALAAAGLRERVKIMIGGAPVNEEYAEHIGADGYAQDASQAVALTKALMNVAA